MPSQSTSYPFAAQAEPFPKRETTLVVVEFSAAWPRWLKPSHFADATVIAQDHGDNPIVLMTEVSRRALQLRAIDCRLGTIVVVSNGAVEVTRAAARHSLVRGLLARLGSVGGGRLVLTVDAGAGRRAEHDLDLLARSFERQARTAGVELAVRVGHERRDPQSAELLVPFARTA